MSKRKKILTGLFLAIIAASLGFFLFLERNASRPSSQLVQEKSPGSPKAAGENKNDSKSPVPVAPVPSAENSLPEKVSLNVPFLAQAPFGIWDPLHEDACEEASLIMVQHFWEKDKNLTPVSGDVEIRKAIRYEEQNNYGISITLEQLNQIAKDYAGMQTGRIKNNATVEDIKKELAAGRPVIVPAAGKILPNPNFRNGGPNYHMLVVVGYNKNGFITNDPGTKRGEGFHYTFGALYNAIHDWDEQDILNGQKAYLVFD